jgi:cytosine deaminase
VHPGEWPIHLTILNEVPLPRKSTLCKANAKQTRRNLRPIQPIPSRIIEDGEARLSADTQNVVELYQKMLAVALDEARQGRAEGGIPIGAALFTRAGELISRGHNRRVQQNDPSVHGETDAFRRAGRQRCYRDMVMVTTLAPCWYCSGLVRQFRIGTLVVGESRTFAGGLDWLRENGVDVIDLDDRNCRQLLEGYIAEHPEVWNEDIGEE